MMPFADISVIAQLQQAPPTNPLMDKSGEHAIYIGAGLLAVSVILIVGLFSRRLGVAIILALVLSAVITILIIAT